MTATPVIGSTFFGLDVSGLGDGLKSIRRRISRSTLLIEFGPRMLQIAEARPRSHGVEIRHFSKIILPEGALERSVPVDPHLMAQLLHDLCEEKGIISHRAAVTLPPEVAFQRLVQLPVGLSVKEARNYLLDPRNGISLPVPHSQTDFDLVSLDTFTPLFTESASSTYQLTAIPCSLLDPVLVMLDQSEFDLQTLELGSLSSFRCIQDGLLQLDDSSICLLLEFLPDATLVNFVCSSGLIDVERLPSIREFPLYELSELERDQILQRSQSFEDVMVTNDRYLPLTEMDLRALFLDLERSLTNFMRRYPDASVSQIFVIGDGSAHPDLAALLQDYLNYPIKQVRPLLTSGLREWSMDEPLLQSSLTRLVGLGLGLLGNDQSFERFPPAVDSSHPISSQDSSYSQSFLVKSEQSNVAPLVFLSDSNDPAFTSSISDKASLSSLNKSEALETELKEDESEWPSLKSDLKEVVSLDEVEVALEEEEVLLADEVEVALEAEESDCWQSLDLDGRGGGSIAGRRSGGGFGGGGSIAGRRSDCW